MEHENAPSGAGTSVGGLSESSLYLGINPTKKLLGYARRKSINSLISVVLGNNCGRPDLQKKLDDCGLYLAFRLYQTTGDFKLTCGNFCNNHLLCPCCSAARSRRLMGKWLPVIFDPRKVQQVKHYMLTLTWPPPRDPLAGVAAGQVSLRDNLKVGLSGIQKLWKRRLRRGSGPLAGVLGMILSVEVTHGPAGWHPHFHVLVRMPYNVRIDAAALREEWFRLTAGRQIRLDYLRQQVDVVEVFKYAFKPADVGADGQVDVPGIVTRYQAYEQLAGARLVRGYGDFYDVKEEDLQQPEIVPDLDKWLDLIYRWDGECYRQLRHVISSGDRQYLPPKRTARAMG